MTQGSAAVAPPKPRAPAQRSVVVIGAGIGGLAAATHLAQRGLRVTVVEKNSRAGGRCDSFVKEGFRFDTGPTLLVMPQVYAAEFAALGADWQQALAPQRVDPTYHLVFDDGARLTLTSDMERMYAQLEALEPGAFGAFLRYLAEGQRHYDLAMARLVNRDFVRAGDFFNLANLPLVYQIKPLARHFRHMDAYFQSPRLKAAFTFQDVYMGLSPFEAPATFSMMPYTEFAHGVWYPRGGMYTIVTALMGLARDAGVQFLFENTIQRIEVEGSRARGVVLEDGEFLPADFVVANADLPYVYAKLLPPSAQTQRILHKRFSSSAISFFWGLDTPLPQAPPHLLFLSDQLRANFDAIERGRPLPPRPSLYLHAPARLDPTAAPAGKETLIAVVPIANLPASLAADLENNRGNGVADGAIGEREARTETLAAIENARAAVAERLALLGIANLDAHVETETVFTPLSWRSRYNLVRGATHGLAHTLLQLGYLRPHNRHGRYHNLYFVGASTHPGTGVPTALISARLTAQRLLRELA